MRLLAAAAAVTVFAAAPGYAQGRPARLPDHWLTLDSLAATLSLTPDQKTKVAEPYTALNAVLKQAATRRGQLRGTMRRPDGSAGEMTPEQRETLRVRMDSGRAEFEALQAEADEWHAAIRNLLTAEQQATLDALPRPRVRPEMRRRGGP